MMDKEEQVIERGCWRITSNGSKLLLWQQLKPSPEDRYNELWAGMGAGFSQTNAANLAHVAAKAAGLRVVPADAVVLTEAAAIDLTRLYASPFGWPSDQEARNAVAFFVDAAQAQEKT